MDQGIHDADIAGHFFRGNKSGKGDIFFNAEILCPRFQPATPFSITDQEKFDLWILADQLRRSTQ